MKAVVLAAGIGARFKAVTLTTPKPLLKVADRPLIDYLLSKLADAGITEVLINTHHHAEQIQQHVDDGSRWNLRVTWFFEEVLLETGGALKNMLLALGEEACMVLSADIWTDYPIQRLKCLELGAHSLYLLMVPNPPFHSGGDFSFADDDATRGLLQQGGATRYNYGGYAVIRPELIGRIAHRIFPMRDLMTLSLDQGSCAGELWQGRWFNVSTPEQLAILDAELRARPA